MNTLLGILMVAGFIFAVMVIVPAVILAVWIVIRAYTGPGIVAKLEAEQRPGRNVHR